MPLTDPMTRMDLRGRSVSLASVVALVALCGCGAAPMSAPACAVGCDGGVASGLTIAAEVIPATPGSDTQRASTALARTELVSVQLDDNGAATLRLPPTIAVTGQVVDEKGSPVAAQLVATRPSAIPGRPQIITQTSTDSKGAFSLALSAGEHQLRVLPQGASQAIYPPLTQALTIDRAAAAAAPTVLRMERGAVLWGSAISAGGSALTSVRVRALDPQSGDLVSSVASTSADGTFMLTLAKAAADLDTLRVIADSDALPVSLSRTVAPTEAQALELRAPALPLSQTYTVPITGRSSSGAVMPLSGVRVEFSADLSSLPIGFAPAPDGTIATFSTSAVTDDEGRAVVALIPGGDSNRIYDVVATPAADSMFARGAFTLPIGPSGGVLGALNLSARVTLSGRLLTPAGKPAVGVVVAARPVGVTLGSSAAAGIAQPETMTDGDGNFLLRLEPGHYDLDCAPPPTLLLPRWSIDDRNIVHDLDLGSLELPSGVAARFTVLDPDGTPLVGARVRLYAIAPSIDCANGATVCQVARLRGEGLTATDGTLSILLVAP